MTIDAVAFDLDGTLYPNYQMYFSSAFYALSRLRFLYYFNQVRKTVRRTRPIEDFREAQAAILAEYMRVPVARAKKRIETSIYTRWERHFRSIRPYKHLESCIEALKKSGFKLGILSDFPIGKKLSYLGLTDCWDCVISAEDSGYLKPNPEPFQKLAGSLKVAESRILFVGNSYEYDIVGASNVGMKTAHLAREPAENSVADITFANYRDLETQVVKVVMS